MCQAAYVLEVHCLHQILLGLYLISPRFVMVHNLIRQPLHTVHITLFISVFPMYNAHQGHPSTIDASCPHANPLRSVSCDRNLLSICYMHQHSAITEQPVQ